MRKILIALCLLAVASIAQASGVTSERIHFVEEDGRHALVYTTNRSQYDTYNMLFQTREGYASEDYIKNFLYIYPGEYTWDTVSQKGYTILKMPGSNFAGLERVKLDAGLDVTADGVYIYHNNRNQAKTPDGHYGLWNSPDNFEQITYSWVFPANLEPIAYRSNRDGKWVRRHNTITYYGSDVNDLEFEIEYRAASHETYDALKDKLGAQNDIQVEQVPTGVKITVAATVLYPSGIAQLTDQGKSLLSMVAQTLKDRDDINIIVEGHTDNVPISETLIPTFPTNWELASARSLNIVHYLVEKGIEASRFESRAFSHYRPIASNDTKEGKAKNRRIELLIEEK